MNFFRANFSKPFFSRFWSLRSGRMFQIRTLRKRLKRDVRTSESERFFQVSSTRLNTVDDLAGIERILNFQKFLVKRLTARISSPKIVWSWKMVVVVPWSTRCVGNPIFGCSQNDLGSFRLQIREANMVKAFCRQKLHRQKFDRYSIDSCDFKNPHSLSKDENNWQKALNEIKIWIPKESHESRRKSLKSVLIVESLNKNRENAYFKRHLWVLWFKTLEICLCEHHSLNNTLIEDEVHSMNLAMEMSVGWSLSVSMND